MKTLHRSRLFSQGLLPIFHFAACTFFVGPIFACAAYAFGHVTKDYMTDEIDTAATLHEAGYNVASIGGGVHPFQKYDDGVWENDYMRATRFQAIGANGAPVEGYVENGFDTLFWRYPSRIIITPP